ncbi:hypothetical protein RP20_CCG018876 [Aedes albopictus]|nr:hypothetical protein RP20_CCG018876 [Aedes albopictus]
MFQHNSSSRSHRYRVEYCDKIQTFSHFESSLLARKLVFSTKPRRAISVSDAHYLTQTLYTRLHTLRIRVRTRTPPTFQSSVLVVVISFVLYLSPLPAKARLRLSSHKSVSSIREDRSSQQKH